MIASLSLHPATHDGPMTARVNSIGAIPVIELGDAHTSCQVSLGALDDPAAYLRESIEALSMLLAEVEARSVAGCCCGGTAARLIACPMHPEVSA